MTNILHKIIKSRGIAVSIVVALGIGIGAALFTHRSASEKESPTKWIEIRPQNIELQLGLMGRIESALRQVMPAPFDGTISKVAFTEGALVSEGDPILSVSPAQIDVQLRQSLSELLRARQAMRVIQDWNHGEEMVRARRSLSTAELNLHDTSSKLKETRQLYERGIVARIEVDSLEQQLKLQMGDLASAKSELISVMGRGTGVGRKIVEMDLENAQARYDDLSLQRSKNELKSPVKGIALRPPRTEGAGQALAIQVGQKVTAGTALVEIVSVEHVHALARVEEGDLHVLHEGMDVIVTGDGFNGTILKGKVLWIGSQAIPSSTFGAAGSYDVVVDISPLSTEEQKVVRIGMSAKLNILTYARKDAMVVPPNAISRNDDGTLSVIYRESMQSSPRRVLVTTGRAVAQGVEITGVGSGYILVRGE